MDTILSVKNENFWGYGEDFTKVLVNNFLESLCINASPFRDEWYRGKSFTQNNRIDLSWIVAICLGRQWWADSVDCYFHLRHVQDLLADGKNFTIGVSEKHLKARSFRLVQVQLYVAKEETFQIQLKYIDVSRVDDSWHVDEVHIIEWKTSLRMCVVREDEDSSKLPDLAMCGLKVGPACQQTARKEKQERAIEKPKIDNARRARGI